MIPQQVILNFSLAQAMKLVAMQDELNTYIHPQWKLQGFDWQVAITDEVMEVREHMGWKWWKEGYKRGITPDNIEQIKLECIDILHFALSRAIEKGCGAGEVQDRLNSGLSQRISSAMTLSELLNWLVCGHEDYHLSALASIAAKVDLSSEQVMETYVQKYVLNKFRQDHGYKDGSYVKVWHVGQENICGSVLDTFREDNEALSCVVKYLASCDMDTTNEIALYTELEKVYNSRLNK